MKCLKKLERKYYKYSYSNWEQPIITTENAVCSQNKINYIGGTVFGAECSVQFSASYKLIHLFDCTASQGIYNRVELTPMPCYVLWYNPNPLNITQIALFNDCELNDGADKIRPICGWEIHGSTDNINWNTLATGENYDESTGKNTLVRRTWWYIDLSNNTNYYKYHRLWITSRGARATATGGWYVTELGDLIFTATEQTITNGTVSDYNFYKDEETYITLPYQVIS